MPLIGHASLAPDPNGHVRAYLTYYLELPRSPHFAVLLSGPWGSGKTFQARKIIGELIGTDHYIFVSLNGISSKIELDDALFAAVYPWTQSREARVGTAIGKALLKHAKIDLPEIDKAELAARSGAKAYVFDDLERCLLPIGETLGYLNEFVERDGRHVVIIADETRLKDGAYAGAKEKLVGKTLAVSADFNAAIETFRNLPENVRAEPVFRQFTPEIQRVYEQSGLSNLRILEQTMSDFSRVHAVLEERHVSKARAMSELIRLFFALSFELRSGRIISEDLYDRPNKIVLGLMKDSDPTPMSTANARYVGTELSSTLLSDDLLQDILVKGVVDGPQIRDVLDASSWFIDRVDEPSWRTVWHSFERDDDEIAAAVAEMLEDFTNRRFDRSGEILHMSGQMLWLADLGTSGWSRDDTVKECKSYIDDLRSQDRLEPILQRGADGIDFGAYGGLGFTQKETAEFQHISEYLREQRALAEVDKYPDHARKLGDLALSDPIEFTRQVAFGRESNALFAQVPVFSSLDSREFAQKLVRLPPLHLREVLLAFSLRYDMASLSNRLAEERSWAENFQRELFTAAQELGPYGRDRVKRQVEASIGEELAKLVPGGQ